MSPSDGNGRYEPSDVLGPNERRDLLRVPPHSLDAEMQLLGAMLLEVRAAKKATSLVAPSDFFRSAHAVLFEAIASVAFDLPDDSEEPTEPLAVIEHLVRRRMLDEVGGRDFVIACVRGVSTAANVEHYVKIVREKSAQRRLIRLGAEIQRAGYDEADPGETASAAARGIDEIQGNVLAASSDLPWQDLADIEDSASKERWLLRGILGIGRVSLLSGDPKAGKSTFLFTLLAAAERGDDAFFGIALHRFRALYVSEEPPSAVLQKARRFGLSSLVHLNRTAAFPNRPLAAIMEGASVKAREVGAELVVIDTWAVWSGLAAKEENDVGATTAALKPVFQAAGRGQFGVLLAHHLGRSGTVRGSTGLEGAVDITASLRVFGQTEEDDFQGARSTKRVLSAKSRYEETPTEDVVADLHDDRYTLAGTVAQARVGITAEKVHSVLLAAGRPVGYAELFSKDGANRLPMKKEHALLALKNLVAAGRVLRKDEKATGGPVSYLAVGAGNLPPTT